MHDRKSKVGEEACRFKLAEIYLARSVGET
jgi:hypothetical protein